MLNMTNPTAVDTSVSAQPLNEPAPSAGEAEMLVFALARSRQTFAWKSGRLSAEALNEPQTPSAMTVGAIIKHLAWVDDWTAIRLHGRWQEMPAPWRSVDWDADPEYPWRTAVDDSPEDLYALWNAAAGRCVAAVDEVLADGGLDRPVRFTVDPQWTPSARRVLVDLHDEYARHVGHVDLFREAIDGLVGEDAPQ